MKIDRVRFAVVAAIFVATLVPSGTAGIGGGPVICIVCGERGLADVLLNILLFLPLGATFAFGRRGLLRPVVTGGLISLAVEVAQVLLPGRDASPGDLLVNTLGTALGVALVRTAGSWFDPPRRYATGLSALAAMAALSVLALSGWLVAPSFPDTAYYGQWTAELGHFGHYRGRVLDAGVGALHVPSRRVPDSDAVRARLTEGAALHVEAVAGPPPHRVAPIFSIYDDGQREILLLAADADDAVFRYRTRAARLRLDRPDLRFPGAFEGIEAGDALRLRLVRSGHGFVLDVNGIPHGPAGFTAAAGWRLLYYDESFPPWLVRILDLVWLVGLFTAAGFWVRRRHDLVIVAGSAVIGLAAFPSAVMLLATPAPAYAAAAAGIALGAMIGRGAQRVGRRGAPDARGRATPAVREREAMAPPPLYP